MIVIGDGVISKRQRGGWKEEQLVEMAMEQSVYIYDLPQTWMVDKGSS